MNLQSIVEMAKEVEHLRKARDLLRKVQFNLTSEEQSLIELTDEINDYFNYGRDIE